MSPREAEKLLGGWATGTLSEDERQSLLRAAMQDQALFDALADEESLRDLLADPAARRRLLEAVAPRERSWFSWMWRPPVPVSALAGAVFAILVVTAIRNVYTPAPASVPAANEVAVVEPLRDQSAPAAPAGPVPAAVPAQPKRTATKPEPVPILAKERRADTAAKRNEETKVTAVATPPPPPPVIEPPPSSLGGAAPLVPAAAPPALPRAVEGERRMEAPRPPEASQSRAADAAAPKAQPVSASTESVAVAPQAAVRAKAESGRKEREPAKAAPPPFRYAIERRQADGSWVEFGSELTAGDEVRLRLVAQRAGYFTLRLEDGTEFTVAARGGQAAYLPAQGSLPSGAGERSVAVSFSTRPATPAMGVMGGFPGAAVSRNVAPDPVVVVRLVYR